MPNRQSYLYMLELIYLMQSYLRVRELLSDHLVYVFRD